MCLGQDTRSFSESLHDPYADATSLYQLQPSFMETHSIRSKCSREGMARWVCSIEDLKETIETNLPNTQRHRNSPREERREGSTSGSDISNSRQSYRRAASPERVYRRRLHTLLARSIPWKCRTMHEECGKGGWTAVRVQIGET